MRIANLILTSQNGGAEEVFIDYIITFKALGHDVLAIIKDDAPYEKRLLDYGIEVKKTKNKLGFGDILAIKNITKYLKEFRADTLVCHMGKSHVLGRKAIAKVKKKNIFQISVNHSDNVKRSIGSDIVISTNNEIFYKTIELGQREDKSFIIPNAISLTDIASKVKKIDLSKKDEITLGLIGRLDRTKGFDYVIKAMDSLSKKTDKKIKLKIAGDGYFKEELLKVVDENPDTKDKIEFLGWIEDKKDFFDSIDIFILPSLNEPFGLVLLQAMKYAKPIITTDCDGPKEILVDKKHALFVAREPIQHLSAEITNKVLDLISDPKLTTKLVENSLLRVQEKYSYDALTARLKEIVG
ncbi:MAG: glycosyltransferase family 4 protein [Rickettsiales bacterium]|nr:glycosyltransferase family 4 protein [Rickettsiales bacterium]